MANNYTESSSFMKLDESQLDKAQAIIDRVVKECEEGEYGYFGVAVKVERGEPTMLAGNGIWFTHNESINPEQLCELVETLVDELEIDTPFCASWAYTCSKPRIGEFGGGAFVVERGEDTIWVDAESEAMAKRDRRAKAKE